MSEINLFELKTTTSQKKKYFLNWFRMGDFKSIEAFVNGDFTAEQEKTVQNWLNNALYQANQKENIPLMEYLLASNTLKMKANINTHNKSCWTFACNMENMEMIKFLSASEKLDTHITLDAKNNYAVHSAVIAKTPELLDYLFSKSSEKYWSPSNTKQIEKIKKEALDHASLSNRWDMVSHILEKHIGNLAVLKEDIQNSNWVKAPEILEILVVALEKQELQQQISLSMPDNNNIKMSKNKKTRKI